jgi:hypothetical protein
LEASTNLSSWTVIGPANDLGTGAFQFQDSNWTNYNTGFYRVFVP